MMLAQLDMRAVQHAAFKARRHAAEARAANAENVAKRAAEADRAVRAAAHAAAEAKRIADMIAAARAALPPPNQRIVALGIIAKVEARYGVPPGSIVARSRIAPFIRPRQEAMFLARRDTLLSLSQLENVFGRDHSTIIKNIAAHVARTGDAQ